MQLHTGVIGIKKNADEEHKAAAESSVDVRKTVHWPEKSDAV